MKQRNPFDEVFTLIFMLLAIGAFVCYFVMGRENPTWLILGGSAVILRTAQYIIRFIK